MLIRAYQHDPLRCEVESEPTDDRTEHLFVTTAHEGRVGDDRRPGAQAWVHCWSSAAPSTEPTGLSCSSSGAGVSAVAIHGNRSQVQRDRGRWPPSRGRRVQALVATDVAARGIHVDDVACVVHFDPAG